MSKASNGIFCISLDFEKYWGVHDVCKVEDASSKMIEVKDIVKKTLLLFEEFGIHATWATVGLLFDKDPQNTFGYKKPIKYDLQEYSPYPFKTTEGTNIEILTGAEEIDWILKSENQELSSHSFSHLYGLEKGINKSEFIEDIDDMSFVGSQFDHAFKSIVFPRNQINPEWVKELSIAGYKAFRGNQVNELWSNTTYTSESLLKRAKRFKDAYFGTSKTTFFKKEDLKTENGLLNIPANRFLRPVGNKSGLEKRKITKVKSEMLRCAENGEVYHLWWHPHNFSGQQETAFAQLTEILTYYSELEKSHGFTSLNMQEIASND